MKKEKILDRQRHQKRDDLTGEHFFGDLGQLILLIIFLAVWITDSFFLKYSTFLSKYIPLYVQLPLAVIILIYAGYLAKTGLHIVFGEVREKPLVIREKVFCVIRHPIYLGAILTYLGMIILAVSIAAIVVWIIIIVFYYFLSRHEEKLLLEKFGKEYEEYMEEVPMLIPRLRK